MKNLPSWNKKISKPVVSWAFYDWGNSAFATSVSSVFFPIYFKKVWAADLDPTLSTFYLGTTLSMGALIFALFAPLLGIFSDFYNLKKQGLLFFALVGSISTIGLFFISQGQWQMALVLYLIGWVGFVGGNLFYDALLPDVASSKNFNFVSSFGYALGYLGGGLVILAHALGLSHFEKLGFQSTGEFVPWIFLSVGVWWLVFTLPIQKWVHSTPKDKGSSPHWTFGFTQLFVTLKKMYRQPNILLFLVAFFFYIDGVGTIYKMAVDFAMSIGLKSKDLIGAIILVQFVSFPATLGFLALAKKLGSKNGILIGIFVYILVCAFGSTISTAREFYALAATIGLVQGGIQALSRAFFGRLIPLGHETEYFGFYNMFGKFSAILGPFIVGYTSMTTGSPRASLLVIIFLFVIGGLLLWKVSDKPIQDQ